MKDHRVEEGRIQVMDKGTAKIIINQVYAAGRVEYSPYSREEYQRALEVKMGD